MTAVLSLAVVLLCLGVLRLAYLLGKVRSALSCMAQVNDEMTTIVLQQDRALDHLEHRLRVIEGKRWMDSDGNVRRAGL